MSQVFTSRVSGDAIHSLLVSEDVGFEFFELDATGVVFVDYLEEWVDVLSFDGNLKFGDEVGYFVDCEVPALIQIKVIEDLLDEGGVASC